MKLKITAKYAIAFLSLLFIMSELHEIVHTSVGRLICGAWGKRDFNSWAVCESCETNSLVWLSTLAGPVFTFIMIWIGASKLDASKSIRQKSLGFSLIFANLPFGRLFNPMVKSGDEQNLVNLIFINENTASIITFILILIITIYPLIKAYKTIENKRKIGYFILFYLVPFVIIILTILVVLNTLLFSGILNSEGLLGSPLIVNIWTVFVLIVFIITRKHIYTLGE